MAKRIFLIVLDSFGIGAEPDAKFTHFVANEHLYDHHIDQAKELIHRANERHLVTFEALKMVKLMKI